MGKVVIGIPAFNEERSIARIVLQCKPHADEVIVVNDGSRDLTAQEARTAGALVVCHRRNQGKGAALSTLFAIARDRRIDVLVVLDGDGQHNPDEIPAVIAPILRGDADMVVGSRYLTVKSEIPLHRTIGQRVFNLMTWVGSGIHCTDSQSGFRAFSRRAFCSMRLVERTFSVECEQQFQCREHQLRVAEVPISCKYDIPPKRSAYLQGMIVLGRLAVMIAHYRLTPSRQQREQSVPEVIWDDCSCIDTDLAARISPALPKPFGSDQ